MSNLTWYGEKKCDICGESLVTNGDYEVCSNGGRCAGFAIKLIDGKSVPTPLNKVSPKKDTEFKYANKVKPLPVKDFYNTGEK